MRNAKIHVVEMNLIYLQEFLVLAETCNYREAADRLYMAQSSLSKHIISLETELGVSLFERTTRNVRLTDYGTQLIPYARQITGLTYQFEAELMQKNADLLTIGTIPTMAQYNIIDLILTFKEKYPDTRVRISEDDTLLLKAGLLNRKYELAFIRDGNPPFSTATSADDLIEKTKYQDDYVVAIIPSEHSLHGRSTIALPELKNHRLCLLKEGTLLFNVCLKACQAADFVPNIFFESHRISNIITMAAKGNCVALLLNQHLKYINDNHAALTAFSVAEVLPRITTTVSLARLKTEKLSPAAVEFSRFFRKFHALIQKKNK